MPGQNSSTRSIDRSGTASITRQELQDRFLRSGGLPGRPLRTNIGSRPSVAAERYAGLCGRSTHRRITASSAAPANSPSIRASSGTAAISFRLAAIERIK
jgi:hypothetical protein